jgi:hypothetical protein
MLTECDPVAKFSCYFCIPVTTMSSVAYELTILYILCAIKMLCVNSVCFHDLKLVSTCVKFLFFF